MSQPTPQQLDAIHLAASCIIEAVIVAGPMGAPSGVVYAALNANGMSLATYQSLIASLERRGTITVENDLIRFGNRA